MKNINNKIILYCGILIAFFCLTSGLPNENQSQIEESSHELEKKEAWFGNIGKRSELSSLSNSNKRKVPIAKRAINSQSFKDKNFKKMKYLANIGRDYDENIADEMEERGKKLDKMKYFASVGKRSSYDGSNEMDERAKKMDKMKYFAGIGKREFDDELLEELVARAKKMDKMKYYGSLGKRDSSSEEDDDFELEERAKKLDKMKYFSSLGK